MTNSDFILGSLQHLEVVGAGVRAPNAGDGEYGLTTLNEMMLELQAGGIDLEYSVQSNLTDDTPIDEANRGTIKAMLAVRMAPAFNKIPSQLVLGLAADGYQRLCRDAVLANQQTQDMSHLPLDQARFIRPSRILTG